MGLLSFVWEVILALLSLLSLSSVVLFVSLGFFFESLFFPVLISIPGILPPLSVLVLFLYLLLVLLALIFALVDIVFLIELQVLLFLRLVELGSLLHHLLVHLRLDIFLAEVFMREFISNPPLLGTAPQLIFNGGSEQNGSSAQNPFLLETLQQRELVGELEIPRTLGRARRKDSVDGSGRENAANFVRH